MNDLHNSTRAVTAIVPAAIGATGTKTGMVVDRQGYGGVEWVISYGSVTTTGTVVTVVAFEGDVTGTLTSIADTALLGTEALASLAAGARVAGTGKEVVKRLGYVGNKRYVRLNVVQTGVTSVGVVGAAAVLHNPSVGPTANP